MVFNTRHIFAGLMSLTLPLSMVATDIDDAITIEKITEKSDAQTNNTPSSLKSLWAAFGKGLKSGVLSKNAAIGLLVGTVDSQNDLNKKTILKIGGAAAMSTSFQSIDAMKNSSDKTSVIFTEENDTQAKIGINKKAFSFTKFIYATGAVTGNALASTAAYFVGREFTQLAGHVGLQFTWNNKTISTNATNNTNTQGNE